MKTIVSFSLLCAVLLLMFLLTPLFKSWGASHPGTLKHASYDLQIETRTAKDTHIDILTRNTGIIMVAVPNLGGTKGLTFLGKYR